METNFGPQVLLNVSEFPGVDLSSIQSTPGVSYFD
jgi:hypothetical protein